VPSPLALALALASVRPSGAGERQFSDERTTSPVDDRWGSIGEAGDILIIIAR
jgi:hypothetical protein